MKSSSSNQNLACQLIQIDFWLSREMIDYEPVRVVLYSDLSFLPDLIGTFPEEGKVKRTIVVPKVLDDLINRKIRGDLLRFYGEEINYSDLLSGFTFIGIASWISEELVKEIGSDLDLLDAFDKARKKEK